MYTLSLKSNNDRKSIMLYCRVLVVVLALLHTNCDFMKSNANQRSALCIATRKGNLDEVRQYILNGADPHNAYDSRWNSIGGNLLHLAVQTHNGDLVKYLLRLGVDPHKKDMKGYPPAFYICTKEALAAWMDSGFDIDEEWGGYGTSCYYELRSAFHNDILDEMLKKGANINYLSAKDGGTVLDYWNHVDKLQPLWFYSIKRKEKGNKIRFIREHGGKTMEELKKDGIISAAMFQQYKQSASITSYLNEPEYDKPILKLEGEEPLHTIQATFLYPQKEGPVFESDREAVFRPTTATSTSQ